MMPIKVVYRVISCLIWMVYLSFRILYFILWKLGTTLNSNPNIIQDLLKNRKNWENAKKVLKMVCENIDKIDQPVGARHSLYKVAIFEAACQNCYEVVAEILFRSPEAIRWKDERGYGIFHLAVIHHSEKVYNLIYDIMDPRSLCGTDIGSSRDNILHLAGRLAPFYKRKTNAAIQLQQDLQLREETPDMVFTKEHQDMLKEAKKWMKETAASCSIIAELIATVGFAAAITIPGGSNQETGIPLFAKHKAFYIFTYSVAISLFLSTTSLLIYLSITTERFAEQDFLRLLPLNMVLGVYLLLISTISMMLAFSAALCLLRPRLISMITFSALIGLYFCVPTMIFAKFQLRFIKDFSSVYNPIRLKIRNSHRSRFDL